MKPKEFTAAPASERIRRYLESKEKAFRRKLEHAVRRYLSHVNIEQRIHGNRWPYNFGPKHEAHEKGRQRAHPPVPPSPDEIEKLINYLFQLRQDDTPTWMRGPWLTVRDGSQVATQLPNSSDADPKNFGEEFCHLLGKYWQLVFGYRHGRTEVRGIGRMIFEENRIDDLGVALLLRQSAHGETLEQIGDQLKPYVDQVIRTQGPTRKKRARTVKQRLRDMAASRLK